MILTFHSNRNSELVLIMFYCLIVMNCFSNLADNTPSFSFPLQLQHLFPGQRVPYFIHGEVEWKAVCHITPQAQGREQ